MSKAIQPLVIVLFILSIGALALGYILFGQREILKGRTAKLQNSHQEIARNIKMKGSLDMAALQDYERMDAPIRTVKQATKTLQTNYETTTNDLAVTKTDLAETKQTLQVTRTELQASQEEVADLEVTVQERDGEIARNVRTIATLEQEKTDLTSKTEGLENEVALMQADIRDWEAKYESCDDAYQQLVVEYQRDESGQGDPAVQFFGEILIVNSDWDFVVINGGSNDELETNMVFLVHRGPDPVGKIRIRKVDTNLSIAEIVTLWEDRSFAEGDSVVPPEGASS